MTILHHRKRVLAVILREKVKVKVSQWCLTLCNPVDYTVHGLPQARTLEWVAFSFSRGFSKPRDRAQVSHIAVDSLPAEPEGKPLREWIVKWVKGKKQEHHGWYSEIQGKDSSGFQWSENDGNEAKWVISMDGT